jgi:ArsR family transcriptional regulator
MSELRTVTECCAPVLEAPLGPEEADQLAGWYRVLGDPARLRLLSLIAARDEVCACDLVEPLGLSQPTVSHHLKVLYESGLVDRDQRGRWVHYRALPERIDILGRALRVSGVHPIG